MYTVYDKICSMLESCMRRIGCVILMLVSLFPNLIAGELSYQGLLELTGRVVSEDIDLSLLRIRREQQLLGYEVSDLPSRSSIIAGTGQNPVLIGFSGLSGQVSFSASPFFSWLNPVETIDSLSFQIPIEYASGWTVSPAIILDQSLDRLILGPESDPQEELSRKRAAASYESSLLQGRKGVASQIITLLGQINSLEASIRENKASELRKDIKLEQDLSLGLVRENSSDHLARITELQKLRRSIDGLEASLSLSLKRFKDLTGEELSGMYELKELSDGVLRETFEQYLTREDPQVADLSLAVEAATIALQELSSSQRLSVDMVSSLSLPSLASGSLSPRVETVVTGSYSDLSLQAGASYDSTSGFVVSAGFGISYDDSRAEELQRQTAEYELQAAQLRLQEGLGSQQQRIEELRTAIGGISDRKIALQEDREVLLKMAEEIQGLFEAGLVRQQRVEEIGEQLQMLVYTKNAIILDAYSLLVTMDQID